MAPRKTGTVTGASLDKGNKGKKGGLTGSKRVTGEAVAPTTIVETLESTAQPTPPSVVAKLQEMGATAQKGAQTVATVVNTASAGIQVMNRYASQINEAIKSTDIDRSPTAITDGKVNTSEILTHASVEIDSAVSQLDNAEATQKNIIIARQRNYVGVAINNVKLKQDLATLDLEQHRLIGLLIDGKTAHVNNEKKAVQYHRAGVGRDLELSKLEQDRELLVQQQIRTEGTQNQTELIREQEQLKVAKLREEIEKQGFEIQNISYEKKTQVRD
ncbi:MAG: hypothetical protein HC862_21900 [Scytonema sp. RU_4_4]|nr:hypothetical protein [Scytonema sp. RU_4_4]